MNFMVIYSLNAPPKRARVRSVASGIRRIFFLAKNLSRAVIITVMTEMAAR